LVIIDRANSKQYNVVALLSFWHKISLNKKKIEDVILFSLNLIYKCNCKSKNEINHKHAWSITFSIFKSQSWLLLVLILT